MSEVKLCVEDARQKDVGKGLVRINQRTIQQLGLKAGDPIEIIGKRTTSAIIQLTYKEDNDLDIIRMDGFERKNCGVVINEYVIIRPAKVKKALNATLAPIDTRLNVDNDFINFVKNRLIERTLVEGDTTVILMLGRAIPFTVTKTNPDGIVRIENESQISILNEPISNESSFNITSENRASENSATPSWASCAESLKIIPDETFEKLVLVVMENYFFDWQQFKSEETAKEIGSTKELIEATIVFLKGLILENLAGNLSIKSLQCLLLNEGKFSQTKVDLIIKHFEMNKNDLRFSLMFNLIQDINSKLEATTTSEYFPAIAARLTELKDLYGHILDVSTSAREDINKLTELVNSEDKSKEEPKKKKLW